MATPTATPIDVIPLTNLIIIVMILLLIESIVILAKT